jgi:hypothetical protein
MNIVTSDLKDSRLKNFLEFFPISKDNNIQIDLKSIKDVAERQAKKCNAMLSKQQLDKVLKKDISSISYAILPLHSCEAGSVSSNTLSYNGDIEFYIRQTEIISNNNNRERLDTVAHSAYNINNLHFFVKNIRQWLLCEDLVPKFETRINAIIMKHLFDENDYSGLNINTPNFNKLSDFGFSLQNWIESL